MDIKSRLNLCSPYIVAEEINFMSPKEEVSSAACAWLKIQGCNETAIFSGACSIVFESDLETTYNIKTNNIGLACCWYVKKDSSSEDLLIGRECCTCSSLSPNIRLQPGCIHFNVNPEVERDISTATSNTLVTKKYVDDNAGFLDYVRDGGFARTDGEALISLGHGDKRELTLQGCGGNGLIVSGDGLCISSENLNLSSKDLMLCSGCLLCLKSDYVDVNSCFYVKVKSDSLDLKTNSVTSISGSCVKVYSEGSDSTLGGIYLTSGSKINLDAEGDFCFHSKETFNGCAQEVYIQSNDVVISSACRDESDSSGSGCSDIGGDIVLDADADIILDAYNDLNMNSRGDLDICSGLDINMCSGCEIRMCSGGSVYINSDQTTRIYGYYVDICSSLDLNLCSSCAIYLSSKGINMYSEGGNFIGCSKESYITSNFIKLSSKTIKESTGGSLDFGGSIVFDASTDITLDTPVFNVSANTSFSENPLVTSVSSTLSDNSLVTKSYVDTAIAGVSGGAINIPERTSFAVSGSPVSGVVTCIKSFYKSGSSGVKNYPSEAPMVYLTRNSDGAYINADYRYYTSSAATDGGVLEIKINSTSDISGITAHVFNIVYDAQTAS